MWADVFARLIVGYLDDHMPWFDEFDVLTGMPAFTGAAAHRRWDHVGVMAHAAAQLAEPRWEFQLGLVVKTAETAPMAGLGLQRRRACAEGPLRRALAVPDPALVAGRRILVVDDVFTEGSTLREVARALVLAGATEVAGLVLARQPWVEPRWGRSFPPAP
jgi:predicted amidophosphoribosyltransferase